MPRKRTRKQSLLKTFRNAQKRKRETDHLKCRKCGSSETVISERTCRNGQPAFEAKCAACGAHIKWVGRNHIPSAMRANLSEEDLCKAIPYRREWSEFEVQAYLWSKLRERGVDVRGEVTSRDGRNRFDLVIFENHLPVLIIEVKPDNMNFSPLKQVTRYEGFGLPVELVVGEAGAAAFIGKYLASLAPSAIPA